MPDGQIDATVADWEAIAARIRDPVLVGMILDLLIEHREDEEGDQTIVGIVFFNGDVAAVRTAAAELATETDSQTARDRAIAREEGTNEA